MNNPFSRNKIIAAFFNSFKENKIGFVLNTSDETLNKLFVDNLKHRLFEELKYINSYQFFVYGGLNDELYFNTKIFESKDVLKYKDSLGNYLFQIQFEDPKIFNDPINTQIIKHLLELDAYLIIQLPSKFAHQLDFGDSSSEFIHKYVSVSINVPYLSVDEKIKYLTEELESSNISLNESVYYNYQKQLENKNVNFSDLFYFLKIIKQHRILNQVNEFEINENTNVFFGEIKNSVN